MCISKERLFSHEYMQSNFYMHVNYTNNTRSVHANYTHITCILHAWTCCNPSGRYCTCISCLSLRPSHMYVLQIKGHFVLFWGSFCADAHMAHKLLLCGRVQNNNVDESAIKGYHFYTFTTLILSRTRCLYSHARGMQ